MKPLRVAIVGAGISGICATIRLRQELGEDVEITVFEKDADVAGTWYENTYPGAACDVVSYQPSAQSH